MKSTRGDERFWASTRGRLILLLRRGNRTVNELAEALGLTDNAVRTHLTALERDGLARPSGTRPGVRRPNVTYSLTADAERLFPKMYGPLLRHFLDVVKARTSRKKLDEIVQEVGQQLAQDFRAALPGGRALDRTDQALLVLRELAGFCESERQDGTVVLRCFDCPLATVVVAHPEMCRLMEITLTNVLGVPVHQQCQMRTTPQCRFEFADSAGTAAQ